VTTRTFPRTTAFLAPVSLTKSATPTPAQAIVGSRVWTAAEDGHPLASPIGWELAVKLGRVGPPDRTRT
jgi:hypothetical protein